MKPLSIPAGGLVETRELLADTRGYGRRVASGQMLTHAVVVDAQGRELQVLCRVKLDNIADAGAGDAASRAALPTCKVCAARDPRPALRLETRQVVPAAYLGPNKGHCRQLTHACWADREGTVRSVLCGRVSELSLDDRAAQDIAQAPDCPSCLPKWRRLQPGAGA